MKTKPKLNNTTAALLQCKISLKSIVRERERERGINCEILCQHKHKEKESESFNKKKPTQRQ